jgi:hypothetical protein
MMGGHMPRCKYCRSKPKNLEIYREIDMCIECVYEYSAIMEVFQSKTSEKKFMFITRNTEEPFECAPLPPEVKEALKAYDKLLFGEENVE